MYYVLPEIPRSHYYIVDATQKFIKKLTLPELGFFENLKAGGA